MKRRPVLIVGPLRDKHLLFSNTKHRIEGRKVNSEDLDIFTLAERLHRKFLDLIQLALDRMGVRDVNSVRALILINLNDTEMTVSELMHRGCYLGSNVSYNLKKLTEAGYIQQVRSEHDRRVIMVRNSPKATELCQTLVNVTLRDSTALLNTATREDDLRKCRDTMRRLEQSCSRAIERRGMESHGQIAA